MKALCTSLYINPRPCERVYRRMTRSLGITGILVGSARPPGVSRKPDILLFPLNFPCGKWWTRGLGTISIRIERPRCFLSSFSCTVFPATTFFVRPRVDAANGSPVVTERRGGGRPPRRTSIIEFIRGISLGRASFVSRRR